MELSQDFIKFFSIFVLIGVLAESSTIREGIKTLSVNSVNRNSEDVSGDGRYLVSWDVNFDTNVIMFDVTVQTTGFVGFGISRTGGMTGADIVIGGVYSNGTIYFKDRVGVGNSMPVIDNQQDWILVGASENSTHTKLKFYRLLDTCDKLQDVKINADTFSIIWSYGPTDDISYHGTNRGSSSANFLDPPMPPVDTSKFDKWDLVMNHTLSGKHTSYWCTIHKTPADYKETRHLVGFQTRLETPESLAHTHHFTISKCRAPPGETPADRFERYVGKDGNECFEPETDDPVPVGDCREVLYIWAVGGKPLFFPEHVGYPMTENGESEYLLVEMHYNNPDGLVGVQFESALEMFNTPVLRQDEAAVLITAHAISYSHMIPPNAPNFVYVAHCGPECTSRAVRPEGINFINVMLHSHLLGRKMKLRHFRGTTELPWILADDNYDFDFQQSRPIRDELKFLPGDQLTTECTTDSRDRDGITIGGFSTSDEMCQSIIWYYPKDELNFCDSAYHEEKIMERYGIESIEWRMMSPPIVTAPESMANKTFNEVVNTAMGDWTEEEIAEFQKEIRYTHHYEGSCGASPVPEGKQPKYFSTKIPRKQTLVTYPEIDKEYVPVDECPTIRVPEGAPDQLHRIHHNH